MDNTNTCPQTKFYTQYKEILKELHNNLKDLFERMNKPTFPSDVRDFVDSSILNQFITFLKLNDKVVKNLENTAISLNRRLQEANKDLYDITEKYLTTSTETINIEELNKKIETLESVIENKDIEIDDALKQITIDKITISQYEDTIQSLKDELTKTNIAFNQFKLKHPNPPKPQPIFSKEGTIALYKEFKDSHLSKSQFCIRKNISRPTLNTYLKRAEQLLSEQDKSNTSQIESEN